jgi:SAM-dependent methyltransferase
VLSEELSEEFARRGPWITRFRIDGQSYGGWYDAATDQRIARFTRAFPSIRNVLELGSLEGGHTVTLAQLPGIERVVGVEARAENLDRARFVVDTLGLQKKIDLVQADLETCELESFGLFDAAFCCGVLYHLQHPRRLLDEIARVTKQLFLSTHYVADGAVSVDSYEGGWYTEAGLADPLSGVSPTSFWPTRDALRQMVRDAGFQRSDVADDDPFHENGPLISIVATRRRRFGLLSRSKAKD